MNYGSVLELFVAFSIGTCFGAFVMALAAIQKDRR